MGFEVVSPWKRWHWRRVLSTLECDVIGRPCSWRPSCTTVNWACSFGKAKWENSTVASGPFSVTGTPVLFISKILGQNVQTLQWTLPTRVYIFPTMQSSICFIKVCSRNWNLVIVKMPRGKELIEIHLQHAMVIGCQRFVTFVSYWTLTSKLSVISLSAGRH